MKVELIATDMDGTLLEKTVSISQRNSEAIKRVQEKGVTFVLASGRPTPAMTPFIKPLGLDRFHGYLIAYNGGMIYDCKTNEILFQEALTNFQVRSLYEDAKRLGAAFIVYVGNLLYICNMNKEAMHEVQMTKMEYIEFENINNIPVHNIIKCMMTAPVEQTDNIIEYLKERYHDLFITKSMPIFVEIMSDKVDKGKTLKRLLDILNIPKKNTIGVGDSYNDISLLKSVGFPVAVENAVPEVKKIAKYIAPHHTKDALKDVIEKLVEEQ